jgi:TRAP-type C4-dicarboxylate transport system substrate-binding protein
MAQAQNFKEDIQMKKILVAVLVLCMMVMLFCSACGSSTSTPSTSSGTDTSSTSNVSAPSDTGTASSGDTAPVEWKKLNLTYATFLLDNAPSAGIYNLLQEKINDRMDGAIQITAYTNGSLLGQPDIYDGVVNGVADMGFVHCSALSDRLYLTLLLEQPGMYYSCSTAGCWVMLDYLNELQPKELDDVIWLLPTQNTPNSSISVKEITSP